MSAAEESASKGSLKEVLKTQLSLFTRSNSVVEHVTKNHLTKDSTPPPHSEETEFSEKVKNNDSIFLEYFWLCKKILSISLVILLVWFPFFY